MNLNQLKKKLIYRSAHRGCKELDIILGDFASKHLMGFDLQQTQEYEMLLDAQDTDIYKWIIGSEVVPEQYNTGVLNQIINSTKNKSYKIFISAGEASGDNLATKLIASMRNMPSGAYEFFGIAGNNMEKTGCIKSIFPIHELSVTGYLEVLPKLFKILFRLLQTALFIKKLKPDIIVTVDAPGFHFPLAKLLKVFKVRTPIIHYVAPTVWAYKPERAVTASKLFEHMMVILPFEKKYFDEVGLNCTYVGNPTIDDINSYAEEQKKQIRLKYGLLNKKVISIMPGSRNNELKHHLPVLKDFIMKMNERHDNLHFIVPTLDYVEHQIMDFLSIQNVFVSKDDKEKDELINISDLIICKSGTSVLESVAKKIPIIAFYKMNSLTAYLIRKKLKIKYVTICNIMMNQEVIPELLQEDFTVQNLLQESEVLLFDESKRIEQLSIFTLFLQQFKDDKIHKQHAADVVEKYINNPSFG